MNPIAKQIVGLCANNRMNQSEKKKQKNSRKLHYYVITQSSQSPKLFQNRFLLLAFSEGARPIRGVRSFHRLAPASPQRGASGNPSLNGCTDYLPRICFSHKRPGLPQRISRIKVLIRFARLNCLNAQARPSRTQEQKDNYSASVRKPGNRTAMERFPRGRRRRACGGKGA